MKVEAIIAAVFSAIVGTGSHLYSYYFYVPSRLNAVPSIAGMDSFWKALFSGETGVWLYSQSAYLGAVWSFGIAFLVGLFIAYSATH
jgi:hypothetical protein